MRLRIANKWRSIKTVKHSACPASASLIRALSSNVANVGVTGFIIPTCKDAKDRTVVGPSGQILGPTRALVPSSSHVKTCGSPVAKINETGNPGCGRTGFLRAERRRVPSVVVGPNYN